MCSSDFSSASLDAIQSDPTFQAQVKRLYLLTLYGRWVIVGLLWLCVAPISLWGLRHEISLWLDYFTWTAIRYSLIYNLLPAFGLASCIGMTIAVLFWQSCNLLCGISPRYMHRLEKQVLLIRQQGQDHPLWKLVCKQ